MTGVLPRLGYGVWTALRWCARHPQPFVVLAGLALSVSALWMYAQSSEAFRITRVLLPAQSTLHLPESVVGENLWRVDLDVLAARLEAQQPSLKKVRVVRELPNVLRIEAIPRAPVAQLRTGVAGQVGLWHLVDREGFILPEATQAPDPRWIRLAGLDRGKGSLLIGKANAQESLGLALRVLAKLRHIPGSLRRRMTELNVADPQQIRFLIDLSPASGSGHVDRLSGQMAAAPLTSSTDIAGPETEVRCGSEAELDTHLARLQATLKTIAGQPLALSYIDVRFQDPVLGPPT